MLSMYGTSTSQFNQLQVAFYTACVVPCYALVPCYAIVPCYALDTLRQHFLLLKPVARANDSDALLELVKAVMW